MQSLERPGKRGWRRGCSLQFHEPLLLALKNARHLGTPDDGAGTGDDGMKLERRPRGFSRQQRSLSPLEDRPHHQAMFRNVFLSPSSAGNPVARMMCPCCCTCIFQRPSTQPAGSCGDVDGTSSLHSTSPMSHSKHSERKTHRAARSDYQQSHDLSARIRGFARSTPPSSVSGSQQAK